ncbi:retrovirus-related pol polyprotein from transposon TNT 1-94 [Tanacetum coccineum]
MAAVNDVPHLVDKKGDDIIESVISCVSEKETWTDLVHNFEGPSDTKENRIMDLKLEYQTFRAKSSKSLSQTYTRYNTLLNELSRIGTEECQSYSDLDLADIYGFCLMKKPNPISEECLRDLDIEYHERALLANSKRFIKRRNNFSGQKANDTECYKCGNKGHFGRDCFSKMSEPSYNLPVNNTLSCSKAVKVLMALADDELTVGKIHARNSEWVDITMRKVNTLLPMDEDADWQNYLKDELLILKQAKLDAVTFQIQNTELIKLNYALQEQLKEEKKINEKWLTSSKKVSQCISEQIPHQKNKVLGGDILTKSSSKKNENNNLFVPASTGYDQEYGLKNQRGLGDSTLIADFQTLILKEF